MGSKKDIHVVTGWRQPYGILQDKRLPMKTRLYLFYSAYSWYSKGVWFSVEEIADLLGADPKSVKRTRTKLVEEGLLTVVEVEGEDGRMISPKNGRGESYRACHHDLDERGLGIIQRMNPGAIVCLPEDYEATRAAEVERREKQSEKLSKPPRIWAPSVMQIVNMDLRLVNLWRALNAYLARGALSALWCHPEGEGKAIGHWVSFKHRAMDNADSRLSGADDPDLRVQVLLLGIAMVWDQRGRPEESRTSPIGHLAGCIRKHGKHQLDIIPTLDAVRDDLEALRVAGVPPVVGDGHFGLVLEDHVDLEDDVVEEIPP